MSRRGFFLDGLSQAARSVAGAAEALTEIKREMADLGREILADEPGEVFFGSYEASYSLTLAYPREFFEQMAEAADIPHAGRDTLVIARDLFRAGRLG